MRKKQFFLNTVTSIVNMLVSLACGFILPRFILMSYGSGVNGLVSSINQFLAFISFMDLGVGAVVQSAYYKPLAHNETEEISKLYVSSKKYFNIIAFIILGYVIALSLVFPVIVQDDYSYFETAALVLIMGIGLFAQYFFSVTDQLLLNADQKLYVQTCFQIGTVIANTVLSVVLIMIGASIHVVKFGSSLVFLTRPLFFRYYVNKHYQINKKVDISHYVIDQKWNGLAQHVATVVMNNTDIMILSVLANIYAVSIYSVYAMITNGIKQLITAMSNGFTSLLGDLYARKEKEKLDEVFSLFEWSIHQIVIILYSIAVPLCVPFVMVYTKGVTDADYSQPLFSLILIAGQIVFCIRIPYNTMICSAGHYKQTQASAIIEAVLNITISLIVVSRFGLVGVAIGTFFAITYRTIYFTVYLRNNILFRKYSLFTKLLLYDVIEFIVIATGGRWIISFLPNITSYYQFFGYGLLLLALSSAFLIIFNLLFYKNNLVLCFHYINSRLKR